ncbi:MAG TPA: leucine-rich repeat protein [Verrucomicrobiae bacterium]|nr:leucine-rich repeat protein [Verrucomicrobiae bacterium]
MKIRRSLTQIFLLGTLLSAASTCSVSAQVLLFDNFQQFAKGTDLTATNYTPSYGPATASVVTSVQNGSPTVTVSNFLGNTWALFDNSVPTNKNQYEGILSSIQTNQTLQVTWNMWMAATNSGPGMFLISVPTSDPNANFNPLIFFTDTGAIIALTNGTTVQVPIGSWGSLAGTVMTNKLVLDYPDGIFSYSLNGRPLATLPLGSYFTNAVGAIYFNGFERSAGSLGNRFALADVEVEAFTPSNIFTYTTNNRTITITGYNGTNTTLIIPDTINGLPVTGIGNYAFENQTGLLSVTIPNSVTRIGLYAFFASGLTSLTIGSSVTNIGIGAFEEDPGLTQVYFLGNAPNADDTVFSGDPGTVYYVPGTAGWANSFGGLPTAQWYQPHPVILGGGHGLGAQTNGFSFTVSWATNLPVIVEACTNLANPLWIPLATNTLSNGFFYFHDLQWTNYPRRFYRIAGTNAFAFFTASPIYGETPLAVQFNSPNVDSQGNAITNWNWNFGDGATSTAQNPSHTYTNIGPFNPGFAAVNSSGNTVTGYGPQITAFTFITTTNNGAITIAGFISSGVGAVTIPGTINSLPVTSIGGAAFSGSTNITDVTIPDTITNIDPAAFNHCPGLTSVIIGNGVINIGDEAFYNCSSLVSATIGTNVTNIGTSAFQGCSLTDLTIPDSVANIGNSAFAFCSGLTSVTIPSGVTSIGSGAFSSCGGLSGVVIGNSVTNIGDQAFNGCLNLRNVYFQGNAPGLGLNVFAGDLATIDYLPGTTGWTSTFGGLPTAEWNYIFTIDNGMITITQYIGSGGAVIIPGTINSLPVTSIGGSAFSGCTNITSVTIPYTVTNIGDLAFNGCSGLTNIYFQGDAPGLGLDVFAGDIATVYFLSGTTGWTSTFGGLPTAEGDYRVTINNGMITITQYVGLGGAVTIPGTINNLPVASIGGSAFSSCTNITSVTIPDTVTNIGPAAFYYCPGLRSVTIPNSVSGIEDYAFSSCNSLSNVVIGNSVTHIGNFAFAFCTSLSSITIPNSVTSIGAYAYGDCSGLTSVTIPNSVTSIGDFVFNSCGGLSNVVIGNNVTNIGNFAFAFCTNLASASIPGSVISLGTAAFQSCGSLASVTMAGGNLGDCAFHSCGGLNNAVIGNSVTNIGALAFAYCTNLTGITIPGGIIGIGDSAFQSCGSLASVTIAGGNIGDYAFSSCSGLNSVVIGDSVAGIGLGAFADCSGLTSVTIGSGVSNFGSGAFFNNYNLQALYFQGNAPALTGVEQLFYGVNTAVAKIYYLPGTTGWTNPFAGLPVVLWNPVMQTGDGSFGVQSNQFGFTITGTSNIPVVVEACTNLANPAWTPLLTGTLANGSLYFSDPAWPYYPERFYRISAH